MRNSGIRLDVLRGAAVAVVGIVLSGCGGPYDASVVGVVTLDGSPLQSGTVKFVPNQAGPSAYGLIDDGGHYLVRTGREEGLPSGSYTVAVVANEPSVPNVNSSLPPAPGRPITPPWYRDHRQSPLKCEVEEGRNEINLELSSQMPAGYQVRRRRG